MSDERLTEDRLAYLERGAAAFVKLRAGEAADHPCHGTATRLRYAEDMHAAVRRLREQNAEVQRLRAALYRITEEDAPFIDSEQHAGDTIEAMKEIARQTLREREVQP